MVIKTLERKNVKPVKVFEKMEVPIKSEPSEQTRLWREKIEDESIFTRGIDEKKIKCTFYKPTESPEKLAIIVGDIFHNDTLDGFVEKLATQLAQERTEVIVFPNYIQMRKGTDVLNLPEAFYFFFMEAMRDIYSILEYIAQKNPTGRPVYIYACDAGATAALAFMHKYFGSYLRLLRSYFSKKDTFFKNLENVNCYMLFVDGFEYRNIFSKELRIEDVGASIQSKLAVSEDISKKENWFSLDWLLRVSEEQIFKKIFLRPGENKIGLRKLVYNTRVLFGDNDDFENLKWLSAPAIKRSEGGMHITKTPELNHRNLKEKSTFKCLRT